MIASSKNPRPARPRLLWALRWTWYHRPRQYVRFGRLHIVPGLSCVDPIVSRTMSLAGDWPAREWVGMDKHPVLKVNEEESKYPEKAENNIDDADSDGVDDSLASIDDSISQISVAPPPLPPAPTGELTLSFILSPGLSWRRRTLLFAAVIAINIGLPFINGLMLGFGEIFARAFIAPWIGLAPPLPINRYSASPADVPALPISRWAGIRSSLSRIFSFA